MSNLLGERICNLRKKKGFTLDKLAELTDSSKSYIWELENRTPPRPSAEKLSKIADHLDTTIEHLLGNEEQDDATDARFYRAYQQMPAETKEKIRKMVKLWGGDKVTNNHSPQKWANRITQVRNKVIPSESERFPVDVKQVAKEFSAQICADDPITYIEGEDLANFEGALYPAPSGKKGWGIIYNNAIKSKGRINFTLAHELGHYLMHRESHPEGLRCSADDIVGEEGKYKEIEREANQFAANLLMPFDDFRKQINEKDKPTLDDISRCAERYETSFTAAISRWIEYTARRSVLVVSREGYILWARSSKSAFKTGLYFKILGRAPISIPMASPSSGGLPADIGQSVVLHESGAWFPHVACEEHAKFSKGYDFNISLLHFDDADRHEEPMEEPEEDTLDKMRW